MKTTNRFTFLTIVLISIGLMASLCVGLAGGVALDQMVLSRGSATQPAPAVTVIVQTATPGLSGVPTQAGGNSTAAPALTPTVALPVLSGQSLDQNLINEAWKLIQQRYVDRDAVKGQTLTQGAIRGMVAALGDTGHSVYMTAAEAKSRDNSLSGEYSGVGLYVDSRNGQTVVVSPIDGTPAQKAGILPGDIIEKVDGEDVYGLNLDDVVSKIVGTAGTQVTLTILTPGTGLEKEYTLTRAKITIHNVTWQALPGTKIAHLRVTQFSKGAGDDFKKALQEIQAQGMTGIILDLRNNPGGSVPEVISVTSQFLKSGDVFQEKDSAGRITHNTVTRGGLAPTTPLVVLINYGSASGSEITAGAIQDAGRAKLIGETTFGTGTVLQAFNLSDGSEVYLAIAEWLTPNGRVIWHTGIKPDETVKLDLNVSALTPEMERDMSAADLQNSKDKQLLRAIELLTNP